MGHKTGGAAGNISGTELRRVRKEKGMPLEDAVARLEYEIDDRYAVRVSAGQLGKIERGEKPVTDRILWGLALVYGVEIGDLFPKEGSDGKSG
jgi:transcriptional regulator with XRE-family HTH domain